VRFAGRDGPKKRGGQAPAARAKELDSRKLGPSVMPMDDLEHRELQALRDQFLETMRHDAEVPPLDEEARRRVGQMISGAARAQPLAIADARQVR
jgi:hypothetical protein